MKKIIINKKKMKNTTYIVFGTFALALFTITRANPSYASDGLILDNVLDAIAQGTTGNDLLTENDNPETTQENEILTPEITTGDENKEGEEDNDLNETTSEKEENKSGEDTNKINDNQEENNENNEEAGYENLNNNIINENEEVKNEENNEEINEELKIEDNDEKILENINQEENFILNFQQPKSENKKVLSSEDNPYIVYDEDKGLITIYTGDFSYGITIQDKNLGADKVGDFGNYYKGGYNIPIVIEDMDDTIYGDENSWGGGGDNSDNNYGYDKINHTVTNAYGRQGPCPEGYHVPSRGEWIELNNIYDIIKSSDGVFYEDLELPLAGHVHIPWGTIQWLRNTGSYHSSSYSYDNRYFKTQFGTDYYGRINFDASGGTHIGQHGESVRCFKNVYEQYRNPVDITYHPNGGAFPGKDIDEISTFTYYYAGEKLKPVYNIQIPNKLSEDISQQSGWMFAGWYTTPGDYQNQTEEFDPNTSTTKIAYAKWLPFNDLKISIGNTEFTLMDRNLGAQNVASGTFGVEDNDKLGYYFQRGNNYGFNYFEGIQTTENKVNAGKYGPNNYYYNNKFILTQDDGILDWSSVHNPNLWGGNNSTNNEYDKKGPCPEGYHIPEAKEWNAIYNIFTTNALSECYGNTIRMGECIATNLKLPYAGSIDGVNSIDAPKVYFPGEYGYYWSSSPDPSSTRSKFFSMRRSSIEPMAVQYGVTHGRNSGFSVRCMKNNSQHNYLKFIVDNQEYDSKELLWREPVVEGLQPDNPTKENATFIGWRDENSIKLFNFGDDSYITENTNLIAEFSCNIGYTKSTDGLNCERIGLILNANGGLFAGNTTEKKIDSKFKEIPAVRKISHTINYKDNGDFIEDYQGEPIGGNGIVGHYGTNKVLYYNAQENITNVISFDEYGEEDQFEINLKYGNALGSDCTKIALWTGNHPNYTYSNNLDTAIFSKSIVINTIFETGFDVDSNNITISFYNVCPSLGYYLTFSKKLRYEIIYDNDEINSIEIPKLDGYDFNGWYQFDGNELSEEAFNFDSISTINNTILYAKRKPKTYTVSFNADNGETNPENITVTYDSQFQTLPVVNKAGYTFLGWYNGDIEVKSGDIVNITENITLKAKRIINKYKIIFDTDGGNEINSIEREYSGSLLNITLPTPVKECNDFLGWNAELPELMPAHDITLKAIWNYTCSRASGGGGSKKSEPTTSEVTNDTTQEHNSADDKTTKPSDTTTAPINEETSKEVISVTQEVADDGTEVEVVVEAVAIKNTNIVATVRTETPVNGVSSYTSSSSSSTTHTQEQTDAYSFAKANGITTTESIETAKMNTELTRIQMAKMLSNFAINVLGEEPDVSKGTVNFDDVNDKMNEQYDNAVTKAYQLGIMGQNVKDNEFRPNDGVTRAEFTTALSRLLYKTDEGEYKGTSKYYVPHIVKLYNEGIVNKAEPKIKEKRGYVMTMLKRTVE